MGEKLGRFIKLDEVVDKLNSCMYARICVMWKPHPRLPKVVEIISPEGLWRHEIEVEEIMVKCKSCKEWGHEGRDCLSGQKGKGRVDRVLEVQLLAGTTSDQSLGIPEINLSSIPAVARDGVLRHGSDFPEGMGVPGDSCPG